MSTLLASFLAMCVADARPASCDDVVLVCGGAKTAVVTDVMPGLRPRSVVWSNRPVIRLVGGADCAAQETVRARRALPRMARIVSDEQDPAPAKAWIGVRLAPTPEALAAHLDRAGLMIANVAKGSPADAAGLERYDVIVAFDGTNTESGEELVAAIAEVGAGKQAGITVIQKGKRRDLKITPTSVPDMEGTEFKYEDPEAPIVDDKTSIHGHTLKIGPDGNIQLEDLGQLDKLPDGLGQLWRLGPGGDFKLDLQPILPGQIPMDFRLDIGDMDSDGHVELQIQTSDDGVTLSVRRDADGRITVDRTDADGKKSTKDYADADALQKDDSKAFELYNRHSGGGMRWLHVQPDVDALPGLQKDFREQLNRRMHVWQENAKDAQRKARDEARRRVRVESRSQPDDADGGKSLAESLSVVVDDDGKITVKVSRNGNRAEYSFKDEADFKAREPELFERYKKMSE